ncbi:unnamed protein product [Blepharisma stoltei]|uniref:Centromere protein J C-terminal domain-containing protein n=1 Tax=Blepharisma stoltei TaxID=1481888 RepID=A0AAU9K046_9CILI|nr:unnamed protein product [Blepharisma stoltei]
MYKKSSGSLFDKAFESMLRESVDESEPEYNPTRYLQESPENEAWGDLQTEIQYKDDKPEIVKQSQNDSKVITEQPQIQAPKVGKIAQKYFNIRPKTELPPVAKEEDQEAILKDILSSKIEELNYEIQKFKKDSDQLKRAKILYEEKQNQYQKEVEDFEKIKISVQEEVEKVYESEQMKLKQELKVHERNQKVLANFPNKKERDEIESLTQTLNKYQEEDKQRNMRYKMNKERAVKQLEDAKKRQAELQDQIKKMQILKEEAQKDQPQVTNNQIYEVKRPQEIQKVAEKKEINNNSIISNHSYKQSFEAYKGLDPSEPISTPEYSEVIPVISQQTTPDGKILKTYESGHKEITFPSGGRKEVYPNGYSVVFLDNEDIKQVFPDGKIVYFYAKHSAIHTIFPNSMEIIKFNDGQIEKHYPNGNKKITYIDGTVRRISADGEEETTFSDSTRYISKIDGEKILIHPGGHKEVTMPDGTKYREYADGRILYI